MEKTVKIKSKNALLELLKDGHKFEKLLVADNIIKDEKVRDILKTASERQIPINKIPRKIFKKRDNNTDWSPIVGVMFVGKDWTLDELLEDVYSRDEEPFFLILNDIRYAHNAGAIMRTAFAAGVNGILTQSKRETFLSEEVLHTSMGTALRIPVVETNLFEAIKELEKNRIRVFAIDMQGKPHFNQDLRGPVAFILGAEDTGVSSKISSRSDKKISIPMREGIDSLNVSVSAGIIIYEKIRQELFSHKKD